MMGVFRTEDVGGGGRGWPLFEQKWWPYAGLHRAEDRLEDVADMTGLVELEMALRLVIWKLII